jgi:Sulfotransferase family
VSGARIVVDSSKTPSHGRILQSCRELDVHVVHLIRDSRAVTFSWQRKKLAGDVAGVYMTRFSPARSSLLWNGMNAAAEKLRAPNPANYLRMRYEDLVTAPRVTLRAILGMLDESDTQLPFLMNGKVALRPVHGFSGNPSRFDCGVVELRRDDEWRSKLGRTQWLLVTALTGPLLVRYGYSLFTLTQRQDDLPDAGEAIDPLSAD